jgi:dTDP-4-dehydrorhamnose 3,5-epimerase
VINVIETDIPGLLVLESPIHRDARGSFLELWRRDRHREAGVPGEFAQDNVSVTTRGVLRGLHYQHPEGQGKLVTVLQGEIYDVGVDLRAGSPTFGRWAGVWLRGDEGRQFYVPEGFAHGFVVTSASATIHYKCTRTYDAEGQYAVRWDDPDLDIDWPVSEVILSPKDRDAPRFRDIPPGHLSTFQ